MAARIGCLDLDTFFVSVERLLDPSLVGRPVVVGSSGWRGVVTSASYEVRAQGVRSGMSIADARRLAPDAVYLDTRHGVYGPYAERVRAILERYTPAVQTASIDEFFLDFHGCERLWRLPADADDDAAILRVVRGMREAIQAEVGLPASVGLATTRPVAKMASGRAKPAGVWFVPAGGEHAFARPLAVRRYPGIGPVAEEKLVSAGISTLGELLDVPAGPLRARFGRLADAVRRGLDATRADGLGADRPAFREHDAEGTLGSISNERTFRAEPGDRARVEQVLRSLTERVCWRARRRGITARTVTLKFRTADFQTVTRGRTIPATHAEDTVHRCVLELLDGVWTPDRGVRLVGVQLSNLEAPGPQLALPLDAGRPAVGSAIDRVRERFGYDAIRLGVAGDRSSWIA